MPFLEAQDAIDGWLGGVEPDSFVWFDAAMTIAANEVQRVAPVDQFDDPANPPADYVSGAKAAELFVGNYLIKTKGILSSASSPDGSVSYVDFEKLLQIVEPAMPSAYIGGNTVYIIKGAP